MAEDLGGGDVPETVPSKMQCAVCLQVLLDPMVNTCGHSICGSCWPTCKGLCPICRKFVSPDLAVNFTLKDVIEEQCPREVKRRRQEEAQEAAPRSEGVWKIFDHATNLILTVPINEGMTIADLEQLVAEELSNAEEVDVETSSVRIMSNGQEVAAQMSPPTQSSRLTCRRLGDNQFRINELTEQYKKKAEENAQYAEEARIFSRLAVDLESMKTDDASRDFPSRFSRLLDAVEKFVQSMPVPLQQRGKGNVRLLKLLAELIKRHSADLDGLPSLIRDLAADEGFDI